MQNINPNWNGAIDTTKDLVAYIDESGDDGFDFSKGCTQWFVASSIISTHENSNILFDKIKEFNAEKLPQRKFSKISFKDLSHSQRRVVLGYLKNANANYLSINSAFYKPSINKDDPMCTYPSMYFIGIKNLIERISWLTSQYNKRCAHILISNRNKIKIEELREYLFVTSLAAGKNMAYTNSIGCVSLSSIENHPKLLLSDYSASTIFQALELKNDNSGVPETAYFDIFLKNKLYSSNHKNYSGVWRNGLKCTPDSQDLLYNKSGILEEGSHKL